MEIFGLVLLAKFCGKTVVRSSLRVVSHFLVSPGPRIGDPAHSELLLLGLTTLVAKSKRIHSLEQLKKPSGLMKIVINNFGRFEN